MSKIIEQVIKNHNLSIEDYDLYGNEIAKIKKIKQTNKNDAKLIVITAMNPTPAGEGKTTTTIGLVDALNKHNVKTVGALREPSLGPVFGMKGTGSGGGLSHLKPFDKINLHFTGDLHAIAAANNLIVAVIENEIYNNSDLKIDKNQIFIKRCLDINDRSLRDINYFIKANNNINTSFNITAASDLMALFCLCENHDDFLDKLSKTIVANDINNNPVSIADLQIQKAILTILEDALYANLVRTNEDNPILVHGGPFANIAHGCNSIIATKQAMMLGDVVVSECGFGSDLGLEKFMNIKSDVANLNPHLIGLVVSLRSLKYHSLDDSNYIQSGFKNVLRHINHIKQYNVKYIVYINVHTILDSEEDLKYLEKLLDEHNIQHARSYAYSSGSLKSDEIAQKTIALLNQQSTKKQLIYTKDDLLVDKLQKVCTKVYGASGFELSQKAQEQLQTIKDIDKMYLCVAKTPYSLSDDAKKLNAPEDFKIKVEHFEVNYFCNMVVAITTTIYRMPGLNKVPAAKNFIMK